jgi:hypothetical protein
MICNIQRKIKVKGHTDKGDFSNNVRIEVFGIFIIILLKQHWYFIVS